jgi:hypothetical protein
MVQKYAACWFASYTHELSNGLPSGHCANERVVQIQRSNPESERDGKQAMQQITLIQKQIFLYDWVDNPVVFADAEGSILIPLEL